jgi:formylmethanofuran dehydrogenase subunit E
MLRSIVSICIGGMAAVCFAADTVENLPQPHYHQQESDPAWMRYAVQLHGHLGPMLSFGARMGMAALQAVDAKGYFDVEIACEGPFVKPPASCFLDGIQISTGATLGKQNLKWTESAKIIVHVKNTRTGKTATLQPKDEFLAMLPQPKVTMKEDSNTNQNSQPGDDHMYDDLARRIAVMPEKEILTISSP